MMRKDLPADAWRKSSYSDAGSAQCVEVQFTPEASVAVGDSKDRARGAFVFAPDAWASFLSAVKTGRFSAGR